MDRSAVQPSDEDLVRAMREGKSAAVEALVARFARPVYTLCFRSLGNHEDARDAVQETFLRLHKYGDRFDASRRFAPWLFGIAANVSRTMLARRPAPSVPLDDSLGEPGGAPEPALAVERADEIEALGRIVQGLPERYRLLLTYRFQRGLSSREIAELLGIPAEQFGINLYRALNCLRSRFGRRP